MIRFIAFLAVVCAAVVLGPMLSDSQGFIHMVVGDYIIETSVTTAVILLVVFLAVLWLVYSIIRHFLSIPHGTARWFRKRSLKKQDSLQDAAYLAYEEGDYAKTVDLLSQSGSIEDLPLRALFVGAKASFNIGKYDLTRSFLDQAEKFSRQAAEASRVVRAKLNLRVNNAKAALEDLSQVRRGLKNRLIYRLYFLSYSHEHDLGKLASISKDLQKYKIITADEARQIDEDFFASQLRGAKTTAELKDLWKSFSRQMRRNPKIAGPFTVRLAETGDIEHARSIAMGFLKEGLDPAILESISKWEKGDREVLDLLKSRTASDEIASAVNLPLLTARGNLEYRLGMNQEALDDYRKALELKSSPEIYTRIGQILASQQNYAEATDCFSKAANFVEQKNAVKLKY
jgi:HemY protein